MEVHAPGSFFLTDATGDKYTLRCLKAGKHAVAYNSSDPTIKIVERCNTSAKFEVQNAIRQIVSLGGNITTGAKLENVSKISKEEARQKEAELQEANRARDLSDQRRSVDVGEYY